jgi:hypothetical protein
MISQQQGNWRPAPAPEPEPEPPLDEPDHILEGHRIAKLWQAAGLTPRGQLGVLGITAIPLFPTWNDVVNAVAASSRSMWANRR